MGDSIERADSERATEAMPPLFVDDRDYPGHIVAGYIIEGELGRGAMGTVYAATHPLTRRQAAIKVLSSAAVTDDGVASQRFEREIRVAAAIQHPSVVQIYETGTLATGRRFLVMERLVGENLRARLQRGPLPLATTVEVLAACASGLQAAHVAGVVHRDLKPENIFLATSASPSTVRILDFGVSKLVDDASNDDLTATGVMVGTVGYSAPEQIRSGPVDERADIYALGVIAFEMLVGRPPYDYDNAIDLMIAHVEAPIPSLEAVVPRVPDALAALVQRMLAKRPEERPRLDDVLAVLAPSAPAPSRRAATPPPIPAHLRRPSEPAMSEPLITTDVVAALPYEEPAPEPAAAPIAFALAPIWIGLAIGLVLMIVIAFAI